MEVIPAWVRRIWDVEELRVLVLLSLVIQIFLIFLSMFRKHSASRVLSAVLWSFYLSADYVATLALGNLLNNLNDKSSAGEYNADGDLLAFWAPFLLLHLGGPDTITAYSIEDNELWWRHLLGLVFQVAAAIVVFLLSLPSTLLWKAAVPVYFAGIVKYAERTLALRSASMDHLMDSMTTDPDPGPSYAKFMEQYASQRHHAGLKADIDEETEPQAKPIVSDPEAQKITDAEIMSKAYHFFKTFRRLIVDLILSFHDRAENQSFFLQCTPRRAFKVIEIELSFMFDLLYTKGALVHSFLGRLGRFLSFGMIILSLIFFCNVNKGNYRDADIIVTYILLVVALWLETISIFLLISSDWAFISLKALGDRNMFVSLIFTIVSWLKLPIKSRWSNSMSQNNLISFCLRDQSTRICKILRKLNLKETWDLVCTRRIKVSATVKELIFDELKEKAQNNGKDSAGYKRFNTFRGEWILQLKGYRTTLGWSIDEVEFDESILLWHIATDLCYYTDTERGDADRNQHPDNDDQLQEREISADYREISRELSNYMLYLLQQRPLMLTAGIGKMRFGDTSAEAKKFLQQEEFTMDREKAKKISKEEELEWACRLLLEVETEVPHREVKGDGSKSILFDACKLAKDLRDNVPAEKRWTVVSAVWVEMLCFAASHCRGNVHARQLSSGGGEFLTHVWFLIAHMGIGEHYRIESGHARAKSIVAK